MRMKNGKNICRINFSAFLSLVAVLCLVFSLASPVKAFAQCEDPISPEAAATAMDTAQTAAVKAMTSALKSVYLVEKEAAEALHLIELWFLDNNLFNSMDWFWGSWLQGLKELTKQIHGGIIDQTRQLEGFYTGGQITHAALQEQNAQLEAKKKYQATSQGCQFDTTAKYLGRSQRVSDAVAAGYAMDFNKIGNNDKDSPAATGPAALQKSRWQEYQSKFCDKDGNGGNAGCAAVLPTAGMSALPSKTIFGKETIDMTDTNTRAAVSQLLFNITGYEASEPIITSALKSAIGLEQQQDNREYIARMDAIGSLAYSVVAERFPGTAAPEIQAMRQKAGITDASPTPSQREIRQAIVEQLSDPGYYKALYDDPSTIPQKELYLKAYNLRLLYDMISKQEKISNAYAIETANMLERSASGRHGATSSAPVR